MAEARPHEPKLRALAAYARGALGARARAQLERHLERCELCRTALTGLGRYEVLLDATRSANPPALDWARVERALERAEAAAARRRRAQRFGWPLAFAAAACVAFWFAREQSAQPKAHRAARPAPERAVDRAPAARTLAVRITALVGRVRAFDERGEPVAVSLELAPREGFRFETEAGAELHLVVEDVAAVLLAADSALELGRLQSDGIELALARGRVVNAVRPLAPDAGYQVSAAGHVVEVRGTHFAVDVAPEELAVQVDEGAVAVLRDGVVLAELRAPASWRRSGTGAGARPPALRTPHAPAAGFERWPSLSVPSWPRVVGWEVDGTRFGAAGELQMRVPPGEVELAALLSDGRMLKTTVVIDALGTRFNPATLSWPAPEEHQPGSVDAAKALSVIRAAQPDLQRCYERSLRQESGGALQVRLRLRLDARGRVRKVELTGEQPVPPVLRDCVQTIASRWRFPAPGGHGITFEAPLAFRTRR